MRVLLASSLYWPDNAPDAKRFGHLAATLRQRGHRVEVLTAFPHYSEGRIPDEHHGRLIDRGWERGILVHRGWIYARASGRNRDRLLNWLSFLPSALLVASGLRGRFDVILAEWPPLIGPLAAWIIALQRRSRLALDVMDIYPDTAQMLGALTNRRLLAAARGLEMFLYGRASKIAVISPGFKRNLVGKGVPETRIQVIPNGVDTSLFRPTDGTDIRRSLGLDDRFVVMYAGNLGLAQGLGSALDAAKILLPQCNIAFVFVGDGAERSTLLDRARDEKLDNVVFVPRQPLKSMPRYMAAADALLIHLRSNPLYEITIPSKTYECMAMGRPLLCAVEGDAQALVEEAGCGLRVAPENPDALAAAVRWLAEDRSRAGKLGMAGAEYARKHLSLEGISEEYSTLLESVAG